MSSEERQIEVEGLWKVFGDRPNRVFQPDYVSMSRAEIQEALGLVVGLRDVSFHVNTGNIFVVMGLSGSGKSTLVRCLIRLIEATSGEIRFDGEDICEYSPKELMQFRRTKVAMVFQHYSLLPHRNVLDNVAYGLKIRGLDKEARYRAAEEAIETVGLGGWESYFPREMSGGMQQRIGLARALVMDSEVILMDEPFSGLDPLIRREMQDQLISLQSNLQKTIVFITHDLNEALKLGDRIAIMRDGEIIQEGSPEEIVMLPTDDYVVEFVRDVSRAKIVRARAIMREPDVVVYERQNPRVALHAMLNHGTDSVFLIARNFTLRGILTRELANDLVSQRKESLEGAQVVEPVTADPDDRIEDIVPKAAQTEYPIAVVGENGSLLGEVPRGVLLASISENG
ncbi:MAG: glycine betaine/L-proline ABC transporter ATP-binding protein [Chloroflexota bacterium]|nr:glycine betaine/L-proline ABC transporter ATP-binding protein [Chloroflexota bacterium]MDE2942373.1 glycine betaine/L-proline ABC transporter ATP-binding protein [Chloroflexota bacterium]MDE3267947.1 glycine betaine/L-proline ABC transporter ATP-binding protein [Chloroflexota bacterium]